MTELTLGRHGPYFILHFFDRQKFLPIIPFLGKSDAVINLVPIDYILNATVYLSFSSAGKGKTYHLTDPNPYIVTEIYKILLQFKIMQKKIMQKFLKVEKEALDYLNGKGDLTVQ